MYGCTGLCLLPSVGWMEGVGGAYSVSTSTCFSETCLVRAPCRFNTWGTVFLRAMYVKQPGACSRHLVNISCLPLPVCEASCTREASAVRNAKIDLHVRMWPLFPECGPDVRLPGEDSRNVTASFFGPSLPLPIWRSLPFDVLLGSEKQEQKRGWYKTLRE